MIKKVVIFLALCSMVVMGCAFSGGGILPETDVGKADYFDGGFRGLAEQFNTEAMMATQSDYIETLKIRRTAILNASGPVKRLSLAAYEGREVSITMIAEVNTALTLIKNTLIYRAKAAPTAGEIAKWFEQAGITRFDSQVKNAKNPWIIAIEIAQALFSFWQQAQHQATLTPEQLNAEFQLNHQWVMDFNESYLIALP